MKKNCICLRETTVKKVIGYHSSILGNLEILHTFVQPASTFTKTVVGDKYDLVESSSGTIHIIYNGEKYSFEDDATNPVFEQSSK